MDPLHGSLAVKAAMVGVVVEMMVASVVVVAAVVLGVILIVAMVMVVVLAVCCSHAGCSAGGCGCCYQSCCSCNRYCTFPLRWAIVHPDKIYPVSASCKEPSGVSSCDV